MKLVLVGSGVRTPLMIHGLIQRQTDLGLAEVVLHDDDAERLWTMGRFAAFVAERGGATFAVRAEHDAREALRGADFVFTAIRVGQDAHRVLDEQIPLRHGVLGQETTGPGGLAMALRTIPVLLSYATMLQDVAPDAWVVNFTNPAGLITQALRAQTGLKVIGICDTPTSMRTSLASFLGRNPDEVRLDYVGLNHLGWVRRVLVDGRDRLPELVDRYDELRRHSHEWALFDPGLIRQLGLLPNEYLYYFYSRDQAVRHIRESGGTRGGQIREINDALWRELGADVADGRLPEALANYERRMRFRSSTYMARERGTAVEEPTGNLDDFLGSEGYAALALDVMEAIARQRPARLVLNVPNDGCLPELRRDDVVEVTTMVDAHGPVPLATGGLPEAAVPLTVAVKAYERLAVEAALTGSREAAVAALMAHPLVGSYPLAVTLVDELVAAHGAFLPGFERVRG